MLISQCSILQQRFINEYGQTKPSEYDRYPKLLKKPNFKKDKELMLLDCNYNALLRYTRVQQIMISRRDMLNLCEPCIIKLRKCQECGNTFKPKSDNMESGMDKNKSENQQENDDNIKSKTDLVVPEDVLETAKEKIDNLSKTENSILNAQNSSMIKKCSFVLSNDENLISADQICSPVLINPTSSNNQCKLVQLCNSINSNKPINCNQNLIPSDNECGFGIKSENLLAKDIINTELNISSSSVEDPSMLYCKVESDNHVEKPSKFYDYFRTEPSSIEELFDSISTICKHKMVAENSSAPIYDLLPKDPSDFEEALRELNKKDDTLIDTDINKDDIDTDNENKKNNCLVDWFKKKFNKTNERKLNYRKDEQLEEKNPNDQSESDKPVEKEKERICKDLYSEMVISKRTNETKVEEIPDEPEPEPEPKKRSGISKILSLCGNKPKKSD